MTEATTKVFEFIEKERERQKTQLELIASENFVSEDVLRAAGSELTNKYAEGYPGRRYYGGCEVVDDVERLAQDRLKTLFGAEAVNVQPHSGSQANMAVYFACLEPGEVILAMDLAQGGHLTHGSSVNFSGRLYKVASYGVDASGKIDFDQVRDQALKHRPKLIVAGASAYSQKIPFEKFKEIADEVGAKTMADIAHPAGLVAMGLHPNPLPYFDFVTSTTHKTLRGPRGGVIMMKEEYAKVINSRVFPGMQGGPLMHIIAAKAVAFGEALDHRFKNYCERVIANAGALANTLSEGGLDIVGGKTENHLMMVDLRPFSLTGAEAEEILEEAGVTVNKNMIPGDPKPPRVTSGIRIGTPALTTRGFSVADIQQVGSWILQVLKDPKNEALRKKTRSDIRDFTSQFPLFSWES